MSGVPEKKAKYHLAGANCDCASCLLEGDDLYVWYEKNCVADRVLSHCFRKIDLNTFSGVEDVVYEDQNLSGFASTLVDGGEYICVSGGGGAVFRKADLSLVFVETEDYLSINGWSTEVQSFFSNGLYYRAVNVLSEPHKGYDVVDVETWDVLRRLNMDMNHVKLIGNGLCYGIRSSKKFAIFSLVDAAFVFELDLLAMEGVNPEDFFARLDDNGEFIAVLYGDVLAVVDPEKKILVRKIMISELDMLRATAADAGVHRVDLCMRGVRFHEGDVILNSRRCMISVDVDRGVCRWVKLYPANVSLSLACVHEDLVFGSKNDIPHAWDRYTGAEVWAAASALPCLSAQVSKGWVVYHQLGGHISCFQWKKPYISPHRPA